MAGILWKSAPLIVYRVRHLGSEAFRITGRDKILFTGYLICIFISNFKKRNPKQHNTKTKRGERRTDCEEIKKKEPWDQTLVKILQRLFIQSGLQNRTQWIPFLIHTSPTVIPMALLWLLSFQWKVMAKYNLHQDRRSAFSLFAICFS